MGKVRIPGFSSKIHSTRVSNEKYYSYRLLYPARVLAGAYKFFNDHVVDSEGRGVFAYKVYEHYVEWCKKFNLDPIKKEKFYLIATTLIKKKVIHGGVSYQVKLIPLNSI